MKLKYMAVLSGLMILGCTKNNGVGQGESFGTAAHDVNMYAVNKTVCNPLGGSGTTTTSSQGVHATLSYLTKSQPAYYNVADMMAHGTQSTQDLFFSEINVPTRLFGEGFPTQSGGMVQDDQGNNLIEYFAIRFQSDVHLGPNDTAGDYQFALLADDGAVLSFSNDGETNYQVAVNDDGTHPTAMGCGSTISMDSSTNLHMRLDYYQGPRYEIALVPLWRKVNSSTAPDPLCGASGNYEFFNPDQNSNPLTNYMALLARGWYPLTAANYSVSSSTNYNPCVSSTPPVISNLNVVNNLEVGYFTVSWKTDVPATDQVLVTDLASNVQTLTTSDNQLRTQHSLNVTGVMLPNHSYSVQAVSVNAQMAKTISSAITVNVN